MEFNAGWCGRIDCGYVWGEQQTTVASWIVAAADEEEDGRRKEGDRVGAEEPSELNKSVSPEICCYMCRDISVQQNMDWKVVAMNEIK